MDLTKDALQFIQSTAPIEVHNFGGLDYTSKPLSLVIPPGIAPGVTAKTLTALIDLHKANFENLGSGRMVVYHVESETEVTVSSIFSDDYGRRFLIATATREGVAGFQFGQFHTQEQFIIGLQSHFLPYGDRDNILKVVSTLASEDKLTIEDNGIAQTATAKSGAVLVDQIDIKPRVLLTPYRTFHEVTQPPSEFLLRVRKGPNGQPTIALFEADGGRWKIEAMEHIAEYLRRKIEGATVIY